jgi:predicted DNA-binding transcriptional regulator AlpA
MKSAIRRIQTQQITESSRLANYLEFRTGGFPKPSRLGANSVGWYKDEVAAEY